MKSKNQYLLSACPLEFVSFLMREISYCLPGFETAFTKWHHDSWSIYNEYKNMDLRFGIDP